MSDDGGCAHSEPRVSAAHLSSVRGPRHSPGILKSLCQGFVGDSRWGPPDVLTSCRGETQVAAHQSRRMRWTRLHSMGRRVWLFGIRCRASELPQSGEAFHTGNSACGGVPAHRSLPPDRRIHPEAFCRKACHAHCH